MKKEDLLQYIRQPQAVGPDQVLEIKKLVRIYPYFQALYLLLAKTSPSETTLRQAAVHTLDRGLLRRLAGSEASQAAELQSFQIDGDSTDLLAKLGAADLAQAPVAEFADLPTANPTLPFGQEPPAFIDTPDDEEDSWLKDFDRQFGQGEAVELDLSADLANQPLPEPPAVVEDNENFVFQKFQEQPDFGDVGALLNDPDYLKLKEQPTEPGLDLASLYGDDDLLPPVSDDEIFGGAQHLPKPREVVLEIEPTSVVLDPPTQVEAADLAPPAEKVPTWLAETASSDIGDSFFDKLVEEAPAIATDAGTLLSDQPAPEVASSDLPPALVAELSQPSEVLPAFDDLQTTSFFSGEAWANPSDQAVQPDLLAASEPPAIVDLDGDGDVDWDDVHALRKEEEGQWYENQPAESWLSEPATPLVDADQDGDIDWDDVHSIRKDEEARWLDENPTGLAELAASPEEEVPTDLPEAHPFALVHEYADRKEEEASYWQRAIDAPAEDISPQWQDSPEATGPEVAQYQTRGLATEVPMPQVVTAAPVAGQPDGNSEPDNFFDSILATEPPPIVASAPAADEEFVGDDLSFFEQVIPKAEPPAPSPVPVNDQWQIVEEFIKKEPRINVERAKTLSEDDLPDLSEPSVQWNVEVASETLAKIYAEQGKFAKVADIYRKLAQNYPERRDEYMARIASLPL
jgi:hypothetical protein